MNAIEESIVNGIKSLNPAYKAGLELDEIYQRAASWGMPYDIRNRVRRFCHKRRATTELDIFMLKLWLSREVSAFHLTELIFDECLLSTPFCFSEIELLRERLKRKTMPFDDFLTFLEGINV